MTAQRAAIGLAVVVAAALPFAGILPGWTPALATVAAFTALSLMGLNLIFGVAGMLAFGQAAFVVLPGYGAGILEQSGVPLLAAIPLGLVISVAVARAVAEAFVRLPGMYFAIGTLGFAFVVEGLARAFPAITGGASGLVLEPPVNLDRNGWYLLSILALALGAASFAWLVRGRFHRTLKLVRHDELAAEMLGIDVARVKIQVFTIGSAYSGIGGILLAYYVRVLAPEAGGVNASLEALAMLVIGGSGSVFGPIIGAGLVSWLFAVSGEAQRFELLVYGVVFFFIVLYAPTGIVGAIRRRWAAVEPRLRKAASQALPGPAVLATEVAARSDQPHSRQGVCLSVDQVTKDFGGLRAVQNVGFDVCYGQIVAVIGPNGAGKSTLFNLVCGIEQPSGGRVLLEGADLADVPIHKRAVSIGRSFQVPRLVPDFTTADNVAARVDHLPSFPGEAKAGMLARTQLEAFGLSELADLAVSRIGLGHHKLIELARASVGGPPLLLLDEPAVGLTSEEVQRLADILHMLKRNGAAILVVEHNVGFVSTVADEVVVLESGCVIARGAPQTIMADPKVKAAYLGALM